MLEMHTTHLLKNLKEKLGRSDLFFGLIVFLMMWFLLNDTSWAFGISIGFVLYAKLHFRVFRDKDYDEIDENKHWDKS